MSGIVMIFEAYLSFFLGTKLEELLHLFLYQDVLLNEILGIFGT